MTAAIIAAGSLHYFTNARDAARQTTSTNAELASVYSSLRDAESGQRGYLLTGNTAYLEPYYSGKAAAPHDIAQLQSQFKGTSQESELALLSQLSNEKLSELAQTIQLYNTQGPAAALALVNTNQGMNLMDQTHTLFNKMQQQVTRQVNSRDHEANIYAVAAYVSLIISFVCTFGLVYFMRIAVSQLQIQSKRLAGANEELARSNEELQNFASIASHDLQEPLRKIQAFGDRLSSSTDLSSDSELYLERMLNAAGRMRALIDDLLTYSRVTTKAKPFKRVSLKRITREVISDMEVRIEETGAQIKVGSLPTIDADEIQMRQVLQNLIANAIKFRREGVKPEIGVYSTMDMTAEPSTVTISVQDNGIGFDEKYADRIFTIFQRLHGRNEYEGTGIGLAVVRKIAERHGGTVAVESVIGKGSRFDITLPMRHRELQRKERTS